jgi:hypothetical protein
VTVALAVPWLKVRAAGDTVRFWPSLLLRMTGPLKSLVLPQKSTAVRVTLKRLPAIAVVGAAVKTSDWAAPARTVKGLVMAGRPGAEAVSV